MSERTKTFPYIPMYRNWYEAIQEMAPEERLETYDGMFAYAFDGNEDFDRLSQFPRIFIKTIRGNMDVSIQKYFDGQKGGKKKGKDIIKDFDILRIDDGYIQFGSAEKSSAFKEEYKTIIFSELPKKVQDKLKVLKSS